MVRHLLRQLLGNQLLGALDYLRYPDRYYGQVGPFNGQPGRLALFRALIEMLQPVAIVETGTYGGVTTELMSTTGLPVFTIEGNDRIHGFARARLWRRRNVKLLCQDSRAGIRSLFDGPLRGLTHQPIFFYLDAHWNDDLPLIEELELIFSRCSDAVIMIDDFQVPHDAGYGYDDYGSGKALTAQYITPVIAAHGLRAFYPTTPSLDEGGMRRGCVVLVADTKSRQAIGSLTLLRT